MTVLVSIDCLDGTLQRWVHSRIYEGLVCTHRAQHEDWECVVLGLMYLPAETISQFRVSPPKEFAVT